MYERQEKQNDSIFFLDVFSDDQGKRPIKWLKNTARRSGSAWVGLIPN
jgi:hypothetical protein